MVRALGNGKGSGQWPGQWAGQWAMGRTDQTSQTYCNHFKSKSTTYGGKLVSGKLVSRKLVGGKLAGGKFVSGNIACANLVCGNLAIAKVVNGPVSRLVKTRLVKTSLVKNRLSDKLVGGNSPRGNAVSWSAMKTTYGSVVSLQFNFDKNQEFPCPQRSHPVDVIFDTVDDFLIGTVVVPGGKFASHGGADQAPSFWTNALCAESRPLALNQSLGSSPVSCIMIQRISL
jgi:hypothetical protein